MNHIFQVFIAISLLFPVITSAQNSSSSIINDMPFCKICTCTTNTENKVSASCTINLGGALFDLDYWYDSARNKSYDYDRVTVLNTPILTLDTAFPPSPIKSLQLSNNSIVNISDGVFSNLQDMTTLVLSYNNIEMLHPDAFCGKYQAGSFYPLKSLQILKLDHNRIHTLDADIFEHTDRLEILTLSHNPFKVIDQQTLIAITSLRFLKELDLSYTEIANLPDNFLHTPKSLKVFDLSGNRFEEIPRGLGLAHNLEVLYISGNALITNLTEKTGFPEIATLKSLHMRNMPELHSLHGGSLSNLINLEELYLYDNSKLVHLDRNVLSSRRNGAEYETWPPLKILYLQNNKLSEIDLHVFPNWAELTKLDLTDNPWTCECENQWMIDELMPVYLKIDDEKAKSLVCAAPIEMAQYTFYDIYEKHSDMRCLDLYGNRPERDGVLLIGVLAGVLITILLILALIYSYQRNWFGVFDNSPAAFSRQFYRRTQSNDEYF